MIFKIFWSFNTIKSNPIIFQIPAIDQYSYAMQNLFALPSTCHSYFWRENKENTAPAEMEALAGMRKLDI